MKMEQREQKDSASGLNGIADTDSLKEKIIPTRTRNYEFKLKATEKSKERLRITTYPLTWQNRFVCCKKTERGKKIWQYLIDLDKAWNTPEKIMARALKMANQTIDKLKSSNAVLLAENQRMKPKEEFF